MKENEDHKELRLRPRPSEAVSINIPDDTLESLKRIAANRDMSCESLIKFYIGQGLRQDTSKQFGDHVLETAAQALSRHIESEEEISAILRGVQFSKVGRLLKKIPSACGPL